MQFHYLVVGAGGRLRKASRAAVQRLWDGEARADALGCPLGRELRLVSVPCDGRLRPRRLYLLRLPLTGGRFTPGDRLALGLFARPDCVTPGESFGHHSAGWPADFFRQLAVALDVPVGALDVPLGVGGPLLAAAALRLTPRQALRRLR